MVDIKLLEEMYKNGRGIQSLGKMFYPKKARSCKNCLFDDFDLHKMKSRRCALFESENGKPKGICIPVRDDSFMSEIHADNISIWVHKYLMKK